MIGGNEHASGAQTTYLHLVLEIRHLLRQPAEVTLPTSHLDDVVYLSQVVDDLPPVLDLLRQLRAQRAA